MGKQVHEICSFSKKKISLTAAPNLVLFALMVHVSVNTTLGGKDTETVVSVRIRSSKYIGYFNGENLT